MTTLLTLYGLTAMMGTCSAILLVASARQR
jgi:hypothetical protein